MKCPQCNGRGYKFFPGDPDGDGKFPCDWCNNKGILLCFHDKTESPIKHCCCPRCKWFRDHTIDKEGYAPSEEFLPSVEGERHRRTAMFCEHANECPAVCPCGDDCYCKSHTCKEVSIPTISQQRSYAYQIRKDKALAKRLLKNMGFGPKPKWSITIGPNKALARMVWRKLVNGIS